MAVRRRATVAAGSSVMVTCDATGVGDSSLASFSSVPAGAEVLAGGNEGPGWFDEPHWRPASAPKPADAPTSQARLVNDIVCVPIVGAGEDYSGRATRPEGTAARDPGLYGTVTTTSFDGAPTPHALTAVTRT